MKMDKDFIKKFGCGKTSIILLLFCCVLPEVSGFSAGKEVEASNYSYMVQIIQYDSDDHSEEYVCGGALLKSNWVITAAHCVDDEDESATYKVYAGLKEVAEGGKESGSNVIDVVIHRNYSITYVDVNKTKGQTVFDIALLKLDRVFKDKKKVRFPTKKIIKELKKTEKALFITGYGCTNKENACENHMVTSLKKKYMKLLKNMPKNIKAWRKKENKKGRLFFATNADQPGLGSGDSGSPLVTESNGKIYIIGIAAMASHCNANAPVSFTNVTFFRQWINKNIQKMIRT